MSSGCSRRLQIMSSDKPTPTTLSNIGVAMFTVANQDAALAGRDLRTLGRSHDGRGQTFDGSLQRVASQASHLEAADEYRARG